MSTIPSGREIHALKTFVPPVLDPSILEGLRAPPDRADTYGDDESSDEERDLQDPVGAFPGTRNDYSGSSTNNYY